MSLIRRLCTRKALELMRVNTMQQYTPATLFPKITTTYPELRIARYKGDLMRANTMQQHTLATLFSKITKTYPELRIARYKSKGNKSKIPQRVSENESDDETKDEDDFIDFKDKNTKTMTISVPSMRVDTLLKAGLGISRNKLEVMFYESKIRVNGEKILKKGIGVKEGDEIDIIKGVNISNPDLLTVARIEILSAKAEQESISVKIKRCKSLLIENYEGNNKWTQAQE